MEITRPNCKNSSVNETPAQPISEERITAAQQRIRELCAQAMSEGYKLGYEQGFAAGVKAAGMPEKKIVLA